jgi:hypothetical protein
MKAMSSMEPWPSAIGSWYVCENLWCDVCAFNSIPIRPPAPLCSCPQAYEAAKKKGIMPKCVSLHAHSLAKDGKFKAALDVLVKCVLLPSPLVPLFLF